jgi:hypothetical protein
VTCSFTGIRADGTELLLPAPAGARFDSADDAPADSFQGVFPLGETCGTLVWLKISAADGETLFYGTVDVQREIASGSGNMLRLTCRSLAGLMLDSEPVPQTYESPALGTIFDRHIKPYGFTSFLGDTAIFRGPLSIAKGMSEWRAAAEFCRRFLRVTPRVRGTVFDASGAADSKAILLDNSAGTRYFRAEVRNRCCDRLTDLFAPDAATGVYKLAAEDGETAALGIRRNRCLTKADTDAAALLKKADRSAFAIFADCPGAPETAVGAAASLNDPVLGTFEGLTVSQVRCTYDAEGLRTNYCFRRD